MYLGRVVGTVVSTSKNEKLIGMKFLLVQKLTEKLEPVDTPEIAVDSVGAGTGEVVIVCVGSSSRQVFGDPQVPVDRTIVGIVDVVEVG